METNNKLREALEATNKFLESAITEGKITAQDITALRNIVSAARSEPIRNYEVGSAKEQYARFGRFCIKRRTREMCATYCPLYYEPCCEYAWAQMPYKGEDDK